MNEYEEQLLSSNNPHWMLSYISHQETLFAKVFVAAIKKCQSRSAKSGLDRFLKVNERLR